MKKALNAWSVPGHVSFTEMFNVVSKAGFEGIELNLDAENYSNHSLTMSTGKDTLNEIKHLSEEYNLKIASISTSLCGGKLGSNDKATREAGKDLIRKQMEFAAALGADGILTVPGGMNEDVSLLQAYENSLTALEELKPEIEAAKFMLVLKTSGMVSLLHPLI